MKQHIEHCIFMPPIAYRDEKCMKFKNKNKDAFSGVFSITFTSHFI